MSLKLWQVLVAGVIATVSMDVLSVIASRLRLTAPLPPQLMGRWFMSVAHARPFHADIARTAAASHELAVGLLIHYLIGAVLTVLYVWGTSRLGWPARDPWLTTAFGLGTSALPWLLMFPAMGYGFFGSHGPPGTRLFVSSLANHAFFGLGIWIGLQIAGVR